MFSVRPIPPPPSLFDQRRRRTRDCSCSDAVTAADCPPNPGRAYQVDVTSLEAIEAAVNAQIAEFNHRLDIFVANAGIPWTQGAALGGEVSHYRKVMTTDLDSVFYSALVCGKIWQRQQETGCDAAGNKVEGGFSLGSFIATASMSGHIVNVPQLQAAYNAAKAGVSHLCEF